MGRPARPGAPLGRRGAVALLSVWAAAHAASGSADDREAYLCKGFEGFEIATADVNGVEIGHRRSGGDGPVVVLIHGWPDNGYSWREVAGHLAEDHDVVVPDYRGVCGSSVPEGGYDKATMAGDIIALMDELGVERAHLVGHDIGMAIAFALAQVEPDRLYSLTMIEGVIPGTRTEEELLAAGQMWHFGFHGQVDLAMDLIKGQIPRYLDHFFDAATADAAAIGPDDRAFYAECYREPGVMEASLKTYAAFEEDAEANEAFLESEKVAVPTLVIGGSESLGPVIGGMAQEIAKDPQVVVIEGSGHFVQNEAPARLAEEIAAFVEAHAVGME